MATVLVRVRRIAVFVTLLASAAAPGCAPSAPPVAPVVAAVPRPSAPAAAADPPASCTIEGDGEPLDKLLFHPEEDLVLFGARRDADPLVRIEGQGRNTLHGRWSELAPPGADGRAQLTLERAGSFRLTGFAPLHVTRFRLRRRTAIVPEHVWIEPDFVVRVTGASGGRVQAVAKVPIGEVRDYPIEVACDDLAYDDRKEQVRDPELVDARAHLADVKLHDAPGGPVAFEAGPMLFYVVVDEERDGFARVRGERHGIRIAGWTPSALVSRAPQGSGTPGGGRSFHGGSRKGSPAKVARKTPLVAERAGVRVVVGEVEAGMEVQILGPSTNGNAPVELSAKEVRGAPGVTLEVAETALAPH